MDKSDVKVHENQSDTSSVITMKEYASSEYPSSEPPPAYMKPRSNALRIAKLAAFTVIVSSIILGGFMFAASWIQAKATRNLDLTLNQELLDDLHPSYEQLIGNEIVPEQQINALNQENGKVATNEKLAETKDKVIIDKNEEGLVPPPPPPPEEKQEAKKSLDLDEIANLLMQKNIRGNVNCIVEKRRNEELVDHAPMSLNLPSASSPFGLNITTPPRLQHMTGEQMIVICKGDEDEDKEDVDEEEKVEQMQPIVFPLPQHLVNQFQQVPQIVPIARLIQQVPLQQQTVFQAIPIQQQPQFQQQPQQIQMQPQRLILHPPAEMQMQQIHIQQPHSINFQQPQPANFRQLQPVNFQQPQPVNFQQPQPVNFQQPQPVHFQQPQPVHFQQPQPMHFQQPQPMHFQQPQPMHFQQPQPIHLQQLHQQNLNKPQPIVFQQPIQQHQPQPMHEPEMRFQPEIIPIRDVRLNEERIPLNHILHNRVPINPLAVNDVPISQMQITHMPMKNEVQMEEEPVPVHHLVPPQPQEVQVQNFNQEEPRFNRPIFQERPNRFPFVPPPAVSRINPEIREPRLLRIQNPMPPKMRFPVFPPSEAQIREIRDPAFNAFSRPIEGRVVPVPSSEMKAPLPFHRVAPVAPEPKVVRMFPIFDEPRRPMVPPVARRIRFPDSSESEESEENRLPIITEITKIIPIRIEKEETKINPLPLIPLNKQDVKNDVDNKLEKLPERPFPIPINAILDMIFRGIRPLMGNRIHNMPIPIDIKIERIENKPLDGLPIIKKFEIMEKETMGENQEGEERQESNENSEPNTLMLDGIKDEDKSQETDYPEKDLVEAKVERVEIFDKEEDNTHPIPIPADAQEAQIFKIESADSQTEAKEPVFFENRAFLPNGQGRGARVFPIPQQIREAEIFSVSDARSNKNMDVEVGSSFAVENDKEKAPEGRQARVMAFPHPEGEINSFPIPEGRAMKPLAVQTAPQLQSQTFTIKDARSVHLYPVEVNHEEAEAKPSAEGETQNGEETRPHYVQPRSV